MGISPESWDMEELQNVLKGTVSELHESAAREALTEKPSTKIKE
jgi:hypothetical protein